MRISDWSSDVCSSDLWAKELTEAGVMNAKVNTYDDCMKDEHVAAVGSLPWVEHQGMGSLPMANIPGVQPFADGSPLAECPHVGQQTREILAGAGYTEAQIAELASKKAIGFEHPATQAAE